MGLTRDLHPETCDCGTGWQCREPGCLGLRACYCEEGAHGPDAVRDWTPRAVAVRATYGRCSCDEEGAD